MESTEAKADGQKSWAKRPFVFTWFCLRCFYFLFLALLKGLLGIFFFFFFKGS